MSKRLAGIAIVAWALGSSAYGGLTFNITYTSNVSSDPNFSSIKTAVQFVESEFSSLYSNNITLNITIDEGAVGLGESSTLLQGSSYAAIRTALIANASSANDNSFNSALPATDPTGHSWFVPFAEAKALGLRAGNNASSDGTYTFDNTQTYTYDPANRGTGGFDFIGVTEHEFSEIMGRTNDLGNNIDLPFDLGRFTGNNTRSFANTGSGVYFSIDNGAVNLHNFNGSGSGDVQDWDGSVLTDPFNASTGPNQRHFLSSEDIALLNVIGYDLAVPEPGTFGLAGVVLIGAGLVRRFTRKR